MYCIQDKHAEHNLALNKEGLSHYIACRLDHALLINLVPYNTRSFSPTSDPGISASTNTDTNPKNIAAEVCLASETDQRGGGEV